MTVSTEGISLAPRRETESPIKSRLERLASQLAEYLRKTRAESVNWIARVRPSFDLAREGAKTLLLAMTKYMRITAHDDLSREHFSELVKYQNEIYNQSNALRVALSSFKIVCDGEKPTTTYADSLIYDSELIYKDLEFIYENYPGANLTFEKLEIPVGMVRLGGMSFGRFTVSIPKEAFDPRRLADAICATSDRPRWAGQDARNEGGFYHPHVHTNGEICFGEVRSLVNSALVQGRILDVIQLTQDVLHSYNPKSPYMTIEHWQRVQHKCPTCNKDIDISELESDVDEDADIEVDPDYGIIVCDACSRRCCASCVRACERCDSRAFCTSCRTRVSCGCTTCREHTVECACHARVCDVHVQPCEVCSGQTCEKCLSTPCVNCHRRSCLQCAMTCYLCSERRCFSCRNVCGTCNSSMCPNCDQLYACQVCGLTACAACIQAYEGMEGVYCYSCATAVYEQCAQSQQVLLEQLADQEAEVVAVSDTAAQAAVEQESVVVETAPETVESALVTAPSDGDAEVASGSAAESSPSRRTRRRTNPAARPASTRRRRSNNT